MSRSPRRVRILVAGGRWAVVGTAGDGVTGDGEAGDGVAGDGVAGDGVTGDGVTGAASVLTSGGVMLVSAGSCGGEAHGKELTHG